MILDFDLDFLKEATALVDGRLEQLESKAITSCSTTLAAEIELPLL